MTGLAAITPHALTVCDSTTSPLNRIAWQKYDLPIPQTHPSTDSGWQGRVQNWLRWIFPPTDVRLARAVDEYQLRLAANDMNGSGKCAYRLGDALWKERRYSTAEHLWYAGAIHFVEAAGKEDPTNSEAIFRRLKLDGIINTHPLLWDGDRSDFIVQSQIGAGNQGEASKLFGENLVIKTPRCLAQMDPRGGQAISSRDMQRFNELILGREIANMLDLQAQGFRIARIHYVDPKFSFAIKDLIYGPNIRGLYYYGLTEEQIEVAEKKFEIFAARDPVMDNRDSNTLYDVNAEEWTIIDA